MKSILLIITTLFVCSCSSKLVDIESGVVAHFPFNGDAIDVIHPGIPVKVGGAILTSDRFNDDNSAYSFDGLESAIWTDIKNYPEYESPQSFSWWYFTKENQALEQKEGAGNMMVLVNASNGTGIQFGFRAPGYNTKGFDSWKWGGGTLLEVDPPVINVWHHCVYTFNGKTHRFYLDGKNVATSTEKPQKGSPCQLMFGNYPKGNQFFKGKLDDVRIYNRVLNESEISLLFSQ